jgi:hypothetical protein
MRQTWIQESVIHLFFVFLLYAYLESSTQVVPEFVRNLKSEVQNNSSLVHAKHFLFCGLFKMPMKTIVGLWLLSILVSFRLWLKIELHFCFHVLTVTLLTVLIFSEFA